MGEDFSNTPDKQLIYLSKSKWFQMHILCKWFGNKLQCGSRCLTLEEATKWCFYDLFQNDIWGAISKRKSHFQTQQPRHICAAERQWSNEGNESSILQANDGYAFGDIADVCLRYSQRLSSHARIRFKGIESNCIALFT